MELRSYTFTISAPGSASDLTRVSVDAFTEDQAFLHALRVPGAEHCALDLVADTASGVDVNAMTSSAAYHAAMHALSLARTEELAADQLILIDEAQAWRDIAMRNRLRKRGAATAA